MLTAYTITHFMKYFIYMLIIFFKNECVLYKVDV